MKIFTGNLLDLTEGTILHQVNCRGIVGGLAATLNAAYPAAFADYFLLCDKYGAQNIGSIHEGHASKGLSVIHLFGQKEPGANTDMDAVSVAVLLLANRPLLRPIYAPFMMGCGIGGGCWPEYSAVLEIALPGKITYVKLP